MEKLKVQAVLCLSFFGREGYRSPQLEMLADLIKDQKNSVLVFGLSYAEQVMLKAKCSVNFLTEDDFEANPLFAGVNDAAVRIASTWYQAENWKNHLIFHGINLGSVVQRDFAYFLLGVLRNIALYHAITKDYAFEEVQIILEDRITAMSPGDRKKILELWCRLSAESQGAVRGHSEKGIFTRWLLGLIWSMVRQGIKIVSGPKRYRLLISSDFKHADSVLKEIENRKEIAFFYLREVLPVRKLVEFSLRSIACYVCPASSSNLGDGGIGPLEGLRDEAKIFEFQDFPFWSSIQKVFVKRYLPVFRELKGRISFFEEFLKDKRITGVLVDEDVCFFNKALVSVAQMRGIPSVVIQHGAPFELVPVSYAPVTASKFAAWGTYTCELMRRWGVPDEKLQVTGAPRYDEIMKDRAPDEKRQKVMIDLNLDPKKKIAVLATDPFHDRHAPDFVGLNMSPREHFKVIHATVKAVQNFPDVQLVIKLHPRDPHKNLVHRFIFENFPEVSVKVLRNYKMFDLLRACDLLITVASTVAIEALACGKPVLCVNFSGMPDLQPHAEKGAARRACDPESLKQELENFFGNSSYQKGDPLCRISALKDYLFELDGKSSGRVAELLLNVMKTSATGIKQ